MSGEVEPAETCPRFYRGQRNERWEVGAKIYRGLPADDGRGPQLGARAAAASRTGRAVAAKLDMTPREAMAVVQHYSAADILDTPTWLIDFSRDPWVGLFFATDGGVSGEIGIVWDISRSEFQAHTAGDGNPIGGLQLVVPPGVSRIEISTAFSSRPVCRSVRSVCRFRCRHEVPAARRPRLRRSGARRHHCHHLSTR